MYLAHIEKDDGREQSLIEHLKQTAELAGDFADDFDCRSWGYGCGMMHDIGKYSDKFQRRLFGGTWIEISVWKMFLCFVNIWSAVKR